MKNIPLPTKATPWGISQSVGNAVNSRDNSLIKYVEFNITGRCEGGCITCLTPDTYPDEKAVKTVDDLTYEFEKFKDMLRKLKEFGLEFLTIYGREPTLWDKEADEPNKFLKDLISWASIDLDVRVCLAISGLSLKESVVRTLFDNRGILFMKNWGSKKSVERLMKNRNAHARIQRSWKLVKGIRKDYKKTKVLAEFLYTGINRADLLPFWEDSLKNGIFPFVEVPVIKGLCSRNYKKLNINAEQYVKDIYNLSILNLSLLYGLTEEEAKKTDIWEPPYGSVFPLPCDKLTKGKSLFLQRDGSLSICSGIPIEVGNIEDRDIETKLNDSILVRKVRVIYDNLEGLCSRCDYSTKLKVCYGCRGNGYSYETDTQGVFGEDPMCFGVMAVKMGTTKVKEFMSEKHVRKVMNYFGGGNGN